MTAKLDQLIELYGGDDDYKERQRAAQSRVNEVLVTIFAEVPELNYINVVGYTPGFCDGDPCTHSHMVAVDAYDPDEAMLSFWEEAEDAEDDDLDEDQNRILNLLSSRKPIELYDWSRENGLTERPGVTDFQRNVVKVHKILGALSNDFELAYDDNTQLEIVRDGDSFTVSKDDYDCGY